MPNPKLFSFLLVFVLLHTPLSAQEVTQLRIKKAMPELNDKPSLYLEVFVPMDTIGLEYNNPVDFERSALTVFRDDAGTDFLAVHQQAQEALKKRGYSGEDPIFRFGGFADVGNSKDIFLQMEVAGAPAAEAEQITIAGTIVFNFLSAEEPKEMEITGVPVEMDYNEPGFATEIGSIKIEGAGSAETDDNSYEKFRVVGSDTPIVRVEVIGGDDAEAVKFWGKDANEFIFSEIPETVDLRVRYSSFTKVVVPLDLQFGIGL